MNAGFYEYWLSSVRGIGCKKISKLLAIFHSPEELFFAGEQVIRQECQGVISGRDIEALIFSRNPDRIKQETDFLERRNIHFTYPGHPAYPKKLLQIDAPPYSLFYKGNLPDEDRQAVAIVGARSASRAGIKAASEFGRGLAENGIAVISGLARGVDIASQKGVLTVAGGRTYGVLGCGIDQCYPESHIESYMMMQEHGGVISEFVPGIRPLAGNFPMRNRIISGLSDAILVIEAKEGSGSLITAEHGMEQGRDVFVVPGNIYDDSYAGSNQLIQSGAALVVCIRDVLDGLGIFVDEDISVKKKKNEVRLETAEKIVYASLGLEPIHISELVRMSGYSVQKTMEVLLSMELKGVVEQVGNQYYAISVSDF